MSRPVTVVCVGDVFGEPGRRALVTLLPRLASECCGGGWKPELGTSN